MLYNLLSDIRGIKPIKTNAGLYIMVRIDISTLKDIKDDLDFAKKIFYEENIML